MYMCLLLLFNNSFTSSPPTHVHCTHAANITHTHRNEKNKILIIKEGKRETEKMKMWQQEKNIGTLHLSQTHIHLYGTL